MLELAYKSSSNLSKPQSVEAFESDLRSVCGNFNVEPRDLDGSIVGGTVLRRLARLQFAEVRLDGMRVSRGAKLISQDPGEHFFAIFQSSGRCLIRQDGKSSLIGEGEMCIVDSSAPSEFVYNGSPSRQISFHLSREEMMCRFGPVFETWSYLPAAKTWFPILSTVVNKLIETEDEQSCKHLEESMLSLMGGALAEISGKNGCTTKQETRLVKSATAFIEERCIDPELTPAKIADCLGVSSRTLQRHFSVLGETPGRRLLEARLNRAHRQLMSLRDGASISITNIAFDCGFSDLSYFHREFRKKFGATPGGFKVRH